MSRLIYFFYILPHESVFLPLEIVFVIVKSVEPDDMPHHAVFHQVLHCLPRKFRNSKKDGKVQETIQLSNTPDPGYHMGK